MGLPNGQAGFTVAELLTVIFIVAIISSVIIGNQSKFGSAAELKNLASSLGLSIRQAQVYGITVKEAVPGSTSAFRSYATGFGVVFRLDSPGSPNTYRFYADLSPNPTVSDTDPTRTPDPGDGIFNNGANDVNWACPDNFNPNSNGSTYKTLNECVPPIITIPPNYTIYAICAVTQLSPYFETCSSDIGGGMGVDPSITEVDIAFRRPNTEATIKFNRDDLNAYTLAAFGTKIVLSTLDGSKKNSVTVYKTGQISVQ